jgi:diamine N-acetyltransferase
MTVNFVPVTRDNFTEAMELRPKRSQYGYIRREAVLYVLAKAYLALPDRSSTPYLIEEDGRYVGFINLRDYGHGVGFSAFFIDRRYQGKGLGRRALTHLFAWVKEHHPTAREIETAVQPENTVASRLYESLGFHYTGVVNPSGTVDMEVQLKSHGR